MKRILLATALLGLTACGNSHLFVVEKNTLIATERLEIEACNGLGTEFKSGIDLDLDGSLSESEVTDYTYICDGQNGENGSDGLDSVMVGAVDPCGDGQGQDEILLQMADGSFMAWYKDLGLSLLNENQIYMTTDAQQCVFKIENGEIVELN